MTGLRERLEGKAARRCVVPVPLVDAGPARQRLDDAVTALAMLDGAALDGVREVLAADVVAASEALAALVVEVGLTAPAAAASEAVVAAHVGPDGEPDYGAALPELLALAADDEGLRDAGWWRDQLSRDVWAAGEIGGLRLAVLYLVADGPRPLVPKG